MKRVVVVSLVLLLSIFLPVSAGELVVRDGQGRTYPVLGEADGQVVLRNVEGKTGRIVFAGYDRAGKMIGFDHMDVSGTEDEFICPFPVTDEMASVKAFVWEGLGAMIPLSGAAVIGRDTETSLFDPTICNFLNNKPAAVSFTFDDSIYDAAVFYNEMFKKYGLCGTSMGVVNNIKNSDPAKWQAIFDEGYIDLGDHSTTHAVRYQEGNPDAQTLKMDITDAYDTLCEWFPNQKPIAFASPWGQYSTAAAAEMAKRHYANRGTGGGNAPVSPTDEQWFKLPSEVAKNDLPTETLNKWIDTVIKDEKWLIELWHGIEPEGNTVFTYNMTEKTYDEHLAYAASKKEQVWYGTFNEVTQYIRERQNATAKILWANPSNMAVTLTDTLDDDLFDFPLTLKVNVPLQWHGAVVTQNGKSERVTATLEGSRRYVFVNVVPDRGAAVLTKIK